MNKTTLLLLILVLSSIRVHAQDNGYADSIRNYQEQYASSHEVVRGQEKQYLRFFPIDQKYRINTRVERIYEAPWFKMETSGNEKQVYRVYAILHFNLDNTPLKLHVYQSQRLMKVKEYADHLFIPFTDLTCGAESYENGRYIDLKEGELEPGEYIVDFNKAYNPYCAYISDRYNCPVPPKENALTLEVRAGEKKFSKEH